MTDPAPDAGKPDDGAATATSDAQVVARNFGVMMVSQAATWILALVGAVLIPRYLGAETVGRLHLASSLWLIAIVVVSFGMNLLLPKEIARNPANSPRLVSTSIALRLALFGPVLAALVVYSWLADYPDETRSLILVIGVASLFSALSQAVTGGLQGFERMDAVSLANIVERIVAVGGAVLLLAIGYGVFGVAGMAIAGATVGLVIQAVALRRLHDSRPDADRRRVSLDSMALMLKASAPYFGVGLANVLYREGDTVVISLVVENDAVLGWYSVYDRFAGTLLFVPTVFILAVYPTLSRLFADAPDGHTRMLQQSFRILLLISVPLGFGLATIARPLVVLLLGDDFAEAGAVMAVGGIVISLTYLNTVFGMFLITMDRQRLVYRVVALGAILTVPLDLILVPYFENQQGNGAIGGAVAYLVTESLILAATIALLPRGSLPASSIGYAFRVVLAGLVMVAAVYPLRNEMLLVPITVGILTFAAMVAILRIVSREERRLAVTTARSLLHRRAERAT